MGANLKRIFKSLVLLLAIVVSISAFCGKSIIARANEQDSGLVENDQNVSESYNVTAPSFSLPTIDGGTVTESTYSSKTQLLVFYRGNGNCARSNNIFSSIASSYWISNSDIQVIAIESDGASASTVSSFIAENAPDAKNIVWAYNGSVWRYARSSRVSFAACAIVKDGKEVEYWDGCNDAETCAEYLRKYVDIGDDPSIDTVKVSGTYCGSMARSMFDSVNSFRTKSNVWQWNSDDSTKTYYNTSGKTTLSPLKYDYDLEKAAMERAKELAVMYSHTRPNGKSNGTITRRSNTTYGENIAYGYSSADSVLEAWIEENESYSGQGHRRNMLYQGYKTIGIGCFYANGRFYWVQEFGNVNGGASATTVNDNMVVEPVEYSSNYVDLSNRYTTLIFYQNDGTSSSVYNRYQLGAPFGSLYNATRKGYKLDGWYTAPEGGSKIIESTVADTIGDVNVYAHWITNRHLEWEMIDGKSYWYENNVRQGTFDDPQGVLGDGTVRGREIYDPSSNAWYWLDSIYDGAKACGKEVWMPYVYQAEDTWDDEEKRNIAYESDEGMGEFVLNAIRNKTGKWVRYDSEGKMLKGWVTIEGDLAVLYPNQAGNTYYYDNRTGLMAKGHVTIGGVEYYFDEMTGVLQ